MKLKFLKPLIFSEELIGKVLFVGVLMSAIIVLFGGMHYLYLHGKQTYVNPLYLENAFHFSFYTMMIGLSKFDPTAFILLGFFILLLTQLARVILTACYFIAKKNLLYFGVSLLVLFLLVYSIAKGFVKAL